MATFDDLLSVLQGASNSAASTVSGPVDGINWILKKAGFPTSDKPVGGSDWLKDKGLMADPSNPTWGTVGEALGGVIPMVASAKAPQIAAQLNQMGANLSAPRTLNPQTGAIVWHGSPHKFDKFDASKIGTGEGAQAYGHGLYVAESPDVAGEYAKMGYSKHRRAGNMDESLFLDRWNTVSELEKQKAAGVTRFGVKWDDVWERRLKEALVDAEKRGPRPENLYKIDLPDEHIAKMLDWDKPFAEMGKESQELVRRLGFGRSETTKGSEIYNRLADIEGQAAAANAMREAGIPGIRYLDGGSRGVGAGTSNFVIFPQNEGLLTILERNGVPIK